MDKFLQYFFLNFISFLSYIFPLFLLIFSFLFYSFKVASKGRRNLASKIGLYRSAEFSCASVVFNEEGDRTRNEDGSSEGRGGLGTF